MPRTFASSRACITSAARAPLALLGVSVQSFSEWTNGKQEPGMKSLRRISALFGIPLGILIDGDRAELAKMYFAKGHYTSTEARIAATESSNHP